MKKKNPFEEHTQMLRKIYNTTAGEGVQHDYYSGYSIPDYLVGFL